MFLELDGNVDAFAGECRSAQPTAQWEEINDGGNVKPTFSGPGVSEVGRIDLQNQRLIEISISWPRLVAEERYIGLLTTDDPVVFSSDAMWPRYAGKLPRKGSLATRSVFLLLRPKEGMLAIRLALLLMTRPIMMQFDLLRTRKCDLKQPFAHRATIDRFAP